ncbi:hypothetical protein GCM10010521_13140 [Streptomyces rameus]|uniref:Uncharacterized protein n=1 Tax=Streptomyces rameus TaxID=68261 RepID=A0ABP6MW07_9ACTN
MVPAAGATPPRARDPRLNNSGPTWRSGRGLEFVQTGKRCPARIVLDDPVKGGRTHRAVAGRRRESRVPGNRQRHAEEEGK